MAPTNRPLSEQELIDWERWSKRDIKWEGADVARLLAMVRQLQTRVKELEDQIASK
jgi:hypothetical protein